MTAGSARGCSISLERFSGCSTAGQASAMVAACGSFLLGSFPQPGEKGVSPRQRGSDRRLLLGGGLLGGGSLLALALALVPVVLLLELLDAAGGIDELHLAREERVAGGADFDRDVLAR